MRTHFSNNENPEPISQKTKLSTIYPYPNEGTIFLLEQAKHE